MKKRICQHRKICFFIIIIMLAPASAMLAQRPSHPFFAGLSLGPSFPVGKYYMNDPDEGSYANPGAVMTAQAGWYFKDHWGIDLFFGEHIHPIDEGGMVSDKLEADPFKEELVLKSGPFEVRTYMLGFLYRTPVYKTLYARGKVSGGVMWARTPDQLYGAAFFGGISYYYTVTSAKDVTPSFMVSAALEHDVCQRIRIALESDFVMGNPEFTFYTMTSVYQVQHHIMFINARLSVNYLF